MDHGLLPRSGGRNKKAVETPRDLPRLVVFIYWFLAADKPLLCLGLPPPVVHEKKIALHVSIHFKFGRLLAAKKGTVNEKYGPSG